MTSLTNTRPIVVGYDGSPPSDAAIDWAATAAAKTDSALMVLHAAGRITYAQDVGYGSWRPEQVHEAARGVATRGVERAKQSHPDLQTDVTSSLVGPTVALDEASTTADLIVVGSHGRGRVGSLLLGSTAYAMGGHARCPVVVVRPGHSDLPGPGRPVVVGSDGSVGGDRAVEAAAELALRWEAELHVVTTWAPPPPDPWGLPPLGYQSFEDAVADRREGAERAAAATVAQLHETHPDLHIETFTPESRPDDGLTAAAASAGIVVLGSRGHGLLSGMVLGSTSRSVLHHTQTPVMIVH